MGTWIEMHVWMTAKFVRFTVVPYVGTWIEIYHLTEITSVDVVVPYVGTWIEILE